MSKIVMITDTHAGVRNDNPAFQSYQKKCYDWFFDYIDSNRNQIECIVHLGDIYDKRKQVNFMSAMRLRQDFLLPIRKRDIPCFIIQGNHDSYFKNTHKVNALTELIGNRYPSITTVSTPLLINVDGLDIQLLPWITESNYDVSMEAIKTPKAEIAMGHLELSGFTMHKGVISEHGYDRSIFDKFDKVFSGHYHHRSTVANVTYIGAFGEYNWHDFNDPRGFSVFDTETRELEFIQNPYKMFHVITYDDVAETEIIEKVQTADLSIYKDAYVKILVVNKTNPYAFDIVFDLLYKSDPIDIQIVEDPSVIIDTEEDVEVNEAENTSTILSKYIEGLTLPVETSRMKRFMLDVYQEALSVETI